MDNYWIWWLVGCWRMTDEKRNWASDHQQALLQRHENLTWEFQEELYPELKGLGTHCMHQNLTFFPMYNGIWALIVLLLSCIYNYWYGSRRLVLTTRASSLPQRFCHNSLAIKSKYYPTIKVWDRNSTKLKLD